MASTRTAPGWSISCNACGDTLAVDEPADATSWTLTHPCADDRQTDEPVHLAYGYAWWCRDCGRWLPVDAADRCHTCADTHGTAREDAGGIARVAAGAHS